MANFKTHLSIATISSSAAALWLIDKHWIDWVTAPWLVFIGTVGGLLPDIDSDNSKQVKIVFLLLALILSSNIQADAQIHYAINRLIDAEQSFCQTNGSSVFDFIYTLTAKCLGYSQLLPAIGIFITVRYLLFYLFTRLTVHRGVFHSILATVFFILLATNISFHVLQENALLAWLNGIFIGLGFIIHLLLDEIYSVDVANVRLKRSFGTAIKLYNYKSYSASIAMLLCTLLLYTMIPPVSL